jgi:AAA ATPase domain
MLDRLRERAALSGLLEAARGGRSGALVVHGEAGVGKTALVEDAIASAAGMRIARVAGIESEMELAYAALQQLCAPMLGGLERLPDPQRQALDVVFGLRSGEPPDRFLVGLAALSLLADAAREQPLLCVIDDAQWLDQTSAQALGVMARRLLGEPVALVVAAREPGVEFRGLPELLVGGLGEADARDLLGTVISRPLDEQVRERFIAETGGNPLALLELPRGLTPARKRPRARRISCSTIAPPWENPRRPVDGAGGRVPSHPEHRFSCVVGDPGLRVPDRVAQAREPDAIAVPASATRT